MTTAPDRCPHAAHCWMGGGSYACVKTPPFCREPLIPKDGDDSAAPVVAERPPIIPMPPTTDSAEEPEDEDEEEDAPSPVTPQKAVMIQGVLF